MALRAFQDFYSALLVDSEVRERFRTSPVKLAAEYGLTEAETHAICGVNLPRLDDFALGLIRSRLELGLKGLPTLREVLRRLDIDLLRDLPAPSGTLRHPQAPVVREASAVKDAVIRRQMDLAPGYRWLSDLAKFEYCSLALSYSQDAYAAAKNFEVVDRLSSPDALDSYHRLSIAESSVLLQCSFDVAQLVSDTSLCPQTKTTDYILVRRTGRPAVSALRIGSRVKSIYLRCTDSICFSDLTSELRPIEFSAVRNAVFELNRSGVIEVRV